MAIGTPTSIGTGSQNAGTSFGLVCSGSAPSNSLVIVMYGWGGSGGTRTLDSVAGGGLTWTIDHPQAFAGAIPWGFGIASAQAPSGATTPTITGTFSGLLEGVMGAAYYCTGLDTAGSPKDVSDGNGASVTTWDTTATSTTFADTLVIGGAMHDGTTTNTATGGATEIDDFQYATDAWTMATEYKILASAQSASLTGTWAAGATDYVAAFVAYKAAVAGTATPFIPHRMPLGV
jgi:hypothetical protein